MRVWIVHPFEPHPALGYPPRRYAALARELAARGCDVTWWSTDFFHFAKRHVPVEHCPLPYEVRQVHAPAYRKNASPGRLASQAVLAVRTAAAMMRELGGGRAPDVALVSLPVPELAAAVAALCRARGIPLIADVTDIWPDSFSMLLPQKVRRALPLLSAPYRTANRIALSSASAVISVSQTYLDWALERAGGRRPPSAIFPWAAERPRRAATAPEEGVLRAVFSGTFGITYDFDLMLEAARRLEARQAGRFFLSLIGDGPRLAEVRAKNDLPNVVIPGPMGREPLGRELARSHAGLCCYVAEAPQSLPIKLYEYLAFGLPVLNTLGGEMAAFVEQRKLGVTVRGPGELAEQLSRLADDSSWWRAMSRAALSYSDDHHLGEVASRMADFVVDTTGRRAPSSCSDRRR